MKRALILIFALSVLSVPVRLHAAAVSDSLLLVLDEAISRRTEFTDAKLARLEALKQRKASLGSADERYRINREIIAGYESLVCDSAEFYIRENIRIAERLGNKDYLTDSKLQLAFVYSISGLFVQADGLFRSIDFDGLRAYQKPVYCWNRIRYCENLMLYMGDTPLSAEYSREIVRLRDVVMGLLPGDSEEYLKEKAFKLQAQGGNIGIAIDILQDIYRNQPPDTHQSAMAAMSLAKAYRQSGDRTRENEYLILAAISDIRYAVKENEALLTLAMNLFEQGDITHSYNYILAAVSDANFFNSRFRNTVIARVQPVIESNYLFNLEKQKRILRLFTILLSIFVAVLVVLLAVIVRQMRIASKARRNLKNMNEQLVSLNRSLGETNIVKERYIGYFMNQCALYINKLHTYRKDVNHKVKSGQIDRLYKPSGSELEKEIEELYMNFDDAFLKLYPDFVAQFNSLLEPGAGYKLEDGNRLNTELRIYALIRLGITNVNQISEFLHCSVQTIYNYKSRIKSRARKEFTSFEEEVRKLGLAIYDQDSI